MVDHDVVGERRDARRRRGAAVGDAAVGDAAVGAVLGRAAAAALSALGAALSPRLPALSFDAAAAPSPAAGARRARKPPVRFFQRCQSSSEYGTGRGARLFAAFAFAMRSAASTRRLASIALQLSTHGSSSTRATNCSRSARPSGDRLLAREHRRPRGPYFHATAPRSKFIPEKNAERSGASSAATAAGAASITDPHAPRAGERAFGPAPRSVSGAASTSEVARSL